MSNNTYSLKAILQSDLDPTLCKLMLHQIKSPLLEHSFQLTTDDENSFYGSTKERSNQNWGIKQQKRKEWGKIKSKNNHVSWRDENKKLDDLSIAQSEYEPSKRSPKNSHTKHLKDKQQKYQIIEYSQKQTNNNHYDSTSNIMSPLQYLPNSNRSFNLTKEQQKESSSFIFDNKRYQNVGAWCGEIFDPAHADQNEVIVNFGGTLPRKKIFQKKQKNQIKNTNSQFKPTKNFYLHFKQAIQKLYQIEEKQVARFIQFIWKALDLLQKVSPYNEILSQNQQKVNKLLLNENPVDFQTKQTITNKNRVINRFKSNKISEVLSKIASMSKNNQQVASTSFQNIKMEQNIAKTLQIYSQIEEVIEDYVSQPYILSDLDKIYDLLFTEQISASSTPLVPHTPISSLQTKTEIQSQQYIKNYSLPNESLRQKLSKLFLSLKIDPHFYGNIKDLGYIWNNINLPNAYSPNSYEKIKVGKQRFMNELCKNDILVNEGKQNRKQIAIEKTLNQMGFTRNLN